MRMSSKGATATPERSERKVSGMTNSPQRRARDTGLDYRHMTAEDAWVVCPRCRGPALVRHGVRRATPAGDPGGFSAHRLTCTRCSHQRGAGLTAEHLIAFTRPGLDACFGLPFWLSLETRHGTLWAQNTAHLDAIERIVGAGLRERMLIRSEQHGRAMAHRKLGGRSLAAVLPRWAKLARNRAEVLAAIERLRRRAAELPGGHG